MQNNLKDETFSVSHFLHISFCNFSRNFLVQVKSMAGGAGEAERGGFVREVAVLACLEVRIQNLIKF